MNGPGFDPPDEPTHGPDEPSHGLPDDTAEADCPCCGETVELVLDPGGGPVQDYVEDCPVCCRPWRVSVRWGPDGVATVVLRDEEQT